MISFSIHHHWAEWALQKLMTYLLYSFILRLILKGRLFQDNLWLIFILLWGMNMMSLHIFTCTPDFKQSWFVFLFCFLILHKLTTVYAFQSYLSYFTQWYHVVHSQSEIKLYCSLTKPLSYLIEKNHNYLKNHWFESLHMKKKSLIWIHTYRKHEK